MTSTVKLLVSSTIFYRHNKTFYGSYIAGFIDKICIVAFPIHCNGEVFSWPPVEVNKPAIGSKVLLSV